MKIEDFLDLLENVHKSGGEYRARCPVHEQRLDGHDLAIKEGDEGILLTCHSGCVTPAIVKELGIDMHNLFYDDRDDYMNQQPEAIYEYTDARGRPVFEVYRWPGKRFSQRLSDADKGEWGLKGLDQKPLFHLPEVMMGILEGRAIYVAEGEKDVLAIQRAGGVATCAVGGAMKWHSHYAQYLRGAKKIWIVADKDEMGYAHAEQVAASLGDIPHEIVQAKQGKDAYDHLVIHNGTLMQGNAPFIHTPKRYHGVAFRSARIFTPGDVEWVPGWESFIPFSGLSHIGGMPGVNKSTLTARMANDVTRLGHGVGIIASEDSVEHVVIPRLSAAGADLDRVWIPDKHMSFPHDIEALRDNIEEYGIRLIIIDPVNAHLDKDVDSNNDKSVRSALAPLAFMADITNCAIVMIGHPNKDRFNKDPMLRIGGSIGIPGISRSAMIMGYNPFEAQPHPERVLAIYKGNWAERPMAKRFRVEVVMAPDFPVMSIRLSDAGNIKVHASQLLPTGQVEQTEEDQP